MFGHLAAISVDDFDLVSGIFLEEYDVAIVSSLEVVDVCFLDLVVKTGVGLNLSYL